MGRVMDLKLQSPTLICSLVSQHFRSTNCGPGADEIKAV